MYSISDIICTTVSERLTALEKKKIKKNILGTCPTGYLKIGKV